MTRTSIQYISAFLDCSTAVGYISEKDQSPGWSSPLSLAITNSLSSLGQHSGVFCGILFIGFPLTPLMSFTRAESQLSTLLEMNIDLKYTSG